MSSRRHSLLSSLTTEVWLVRTLAFVTLMALPASPSVAEDWLEETYTFNLGVTSPAFDATFEYNVDVPLFDTAGGARTLQAYRVDWALNCDYTYFLNPNPTEYWHGCDVSWQQQWNATRDGAAWFPQNQPSGLLQTSTGTGAVVGPGFAGTDPFQITGAGGSGSETQTSAALLAQMTGPGVATIECTHVLSVMTAASPGDRAWPPTVPVSLRVFDPTMINLTLDAIHMNLTVTYYWIPEPSTFGLTALGALALIRRR